MRLTSKSQTNIYRSIEHLRVIQISNGKAISAKQLPASGLSLELFVNGTKVVTLLRTLKNEEALALGVVQSEDLIDSATDIDRVEFSTKKQQNHFFRGIFSRRYCQLYLRIL